MIYFDRTAHLLTYQHATRGSLESDGSGQLSSRGLTPGDNRLRVLITGGGPVGLILASALIELFQGNIDITVYDGRWKQTADGVSWKSEEDRNNRRQQVVTLQSKPIAMLPPLLQQALLSNKGFAEIWPYSEDSPVHIGRPRNFRILDIEDRLLRHARETGIRLIPEKFALDRAGSSHYDILAICEGAHSETREKLGSSFGGTDPIPYSIQGRPVRDFVLGLKVKSAMNSAEAVVLTLVQNRFLLNADQNGQGYLNMRLTEAEASEFWAGNNTPSRALWSRIAQGLKLFDICPDSLETINSYALSMEHRSRFSANLGWNEDDTPRYGFLLGDAANALHFWPGRGLNQGLLTALSLARCIHERCRNGKRLRDADLSRHEAVMHMLQHRHKSRAWHAMVRRIDGRIRPVRDLIAEGMQTPCAPRNRLQSELIQRCRQTKMRLQGRLPGLPSEEALISRLSGMNNETLATLAASQPWDTCLSAGPEVDLDMFYALLPARENSEYPEPDRVSVHAVCN